MIETSLCITSYNRPRRLEEVLKSFFMTNMYDLNKLELIIVDNGSTDDSKTKLPLEFANIRLISVDKNLGCEEGFNIGMEYFTSRKSKN